MSRILYVDVIGGAAGDMLLAALIDAGAPLEVVREAVDAVVPGRFSFDTEVVTRGGLRARLLRIEGRRGGPADLTPRPFEDLMLAVDRASLGAGIAATARSVLERIGRAEARVHGIGLDDLRLHELGDDDTLLDVVGIAAALDELGVDRMLVSTIPLGSGRPMPGRHVHGEVPLPATVTLELLRGFAVRGEGGSETVTPTAAAVLAALGEPTPRFPSMTIEAVGYGAGNDDPEGRANVVRVIVGPSATRAEDPTERGGRRGPVVRELVVLEANLDDLTPELVEDASRALLAGGALDVWTAPVHMKKGRPGFVLSALCDPVDELRLRTIFFQSTPTLGVRSHAVRRSELERRTVAVAVGDGSIRVKVGLLEGRIVTATPEHDDVASLASRSGRPVRDVYEEAAATARALRYAQAGS